MDRTIVLRPHPVARYANLSLGLVLIVGSTFVFIKLSATHNDSTWTAISAGALALGVTLFVRMWRYSITLSPARMIVRGVLWSRSMPRDTITRVGTFGWVTWADGRGRIRRTPLTMFWTSGRSLPEFEMWSAEGLDQVRVWARG